MKQKPGPMMKSHWVASEDEVTALRDRIDALERELAVAKLEAGHHFTNACINGAYSAHHRETLNNLIIMMGDSRERRHIVKLCQDSLEWEVPKE